MSRLLWLAVPLCAAFFIIVTLALCVVVATGALAHDIYMNVYEHNAPKSEPRKLCCGGDENTGDCEGLGYDGMQEVAGGVFILSKRYKAKVFVPTHRITWDIPRDGYSGEAADKHGTYPIHWCGKPRPSSWPPTKDDPDPSWVTFCIFVAPGGV